jgi:hypothetical protein
MAPLHLIVWPIFQRAYSRVPHSRQMIVTFVGFAASAAAGQQFGSTSVSGPGNDGCVIL